jgi:hypothetical protein
MASFLICGFYDFFTPPPVTKKRDVTPTNRADLHTATTLPIRFIKLHDLTVSEDRERRHAVSARNISSIQSSGLLGRADW